MMKPDDVIKRIERQEVIDLAAELGVPIKQVERRELDALAHGATHGGVLAIGQGSIVRIDEWLNLFDQKLRIKLCLPPARMLIRGILEADPATSELILTSCHPGVTADRVRGATAWPLKVADAVQETSAPTPLELSALRDLHIAA